jgi:hypothetical protein
MGERQKVTDLEACHEVDSEVRKIATSPEPGYEGRPTLDQPLLL